MHDTDVAIIGAGQAGLAMSRCLAERRIDHLVFERGTIGERWRSGTWDSLRLLTPNWMNGLPWHPYDGSDPHGYMTRDEFVSFLEAYSSGAPVITKADVRSVNASADRYEVVTSAGSWRSRVVVIATGHCDQPCIPALAQNLPPDVKSIHSSHYRAPGALPQGKVLVIGASSSGVQIADELRRSGREVILSVGRHTRLPRTWRGKDIFFWLDKIGLLDRSAGDIADLKAARLQPSLQLVGRPDRATIDLPALQTAGVRLVGRVTGADRYLVSFGPDLQETVAAAEAKLRRIVGAIEASAGRPPAALRFDALVPGTFPGPASMSLRDEAIRTVIWATGFNRSYPWLNLPVLSADGEIAHEGGITALSGVYALGFRFLRRRDSNFIRGAGFDAHALSEHVAAYLRVESRWAA